MYICIVVTIFIIFTYKIRHQPLPANIRCRKEEFQDAQQKREYKSQQRREKTIKSSKKIKIH